MRARVFRGEFFLARYPRRHVFLVSRTARFPLFPPVFSRFSILSRLGPAVRPSVRLGFFVSVSRVLKGHARPLARKPLALRTRHGRTRHPSINHPRRGRIFLPRLFCPACAFCSARDPAKNTPLRWYLEGSALAILSAVSSARQDYSFLPRPFDFSPRRFFNNAIILPLPNRAGD